MRIAALDGSRATVRARMYIIACGGIETARLLLLSNGSRPKGSAIDTISLAAISWSTRIQMPAAS